MTAYVGYENDQQMLNEWWLQKLGNDCCNELLNFWWLEVLNKYWLQLFVVMMMLYIKRWNYDELTWLSEYWWMQLIVAMTLITIDCWIYELIEYIDYFKK